MVYGTAAELGGALPHLPDPHLGKYFFQKLTFMVAASSGPFKDCWLGRM